MFSIRPREAYSRPDTLPPLIVVGGFGEHRRDLVANGTPATIDKKDRTSVVQYFRNGSHLLVLTLGTTRE